MNIKKGRNDSLVGNKNSSLCIFPNNFFIIFKSLLCKERLLEEWNFFADRNYNFNKHKNYILGSAMSPTMSTEVYTISKVKHAIPFLFD